MLKAYDIMEFVLYHLGQEPIENFTFNKEQRHTGYS